MIGIERRFSDDTRLIDLTVGDLKELITSLISKIKQIEEKRYVYGLQGLADLLHCTKRHASKIKSIIRKSKFPQNPKRSVRFSGKRTKRSVQKRKARNTQKAETKVL